jgi:hypothetical protein
MDYSKFKQLILAGEKPTVDFKIECHAFASGALVDWDLSPNRAQFSWKVDASVFIPEVGQDLMERIKKTYDQAPKHKKNDTVGKNRDLAELLYERTSRWLRNRVTVNG